MQHERAERVKRLEQKKADMAAAMEDVRLQEQARRNALRVQQEMAEISAYEKTFGKVRNDVTFNYLSVQFISFIKISWWGQTSQWLIQAS